MTAIHKKPCNNHTDSKLPSQIKKPNSYWWLRWLMPLSGFIAFIWFLIRVIPKPTRATYPCQRAAAPLAAGFVIWLLSIFGSITAWLKAKQHLRQLRYRLAAFFLVVSVIAAVTALVHTPEKTAAAVPQPNIVLGTAKGLHPGRVVWTYAPDATNWDGTTGYWWNRTCTNQTLLEKMLSSTIRSIVSSPSDINDSAAWQAIFRNFNQTKGKGNVGYQSGEKITIKINLVTCNPTCHTVDSNYNEVTALEYVNTSPYLIVALIKQLISIGVRQQDIYVGDTTAYFPNHYWNICHNAYPNVNYFDCGGKFGRLLAQPSDVRMYWSTSHADGSLPDYAPIYYAQAEYFINLACLKAHPAGPTLCGKNHYGSLCRIPVEQNYYDLHADLSWNYGTLGMGKYRNLVDLMGHSQIGGKTLLNIIDGFWGGYGSLNVVPPQKWNMPPFNNDWPSSLFASQDPVAIDSVGYDFLWAEDDASGTIYPYSALHYAKVDGGDDYLHEAALADNPPSGTFYDPDNSGNCLPSLGVHEHWNNSADKQYSRNLGTGTGIELLRVNVTYDVFAGDLDGDHNVDFSDYAILASHWLATGCNAGNNWCGGADIDKNTTVSLPDLNLLINNWLFGF